MLRWVQSDLEQLIEEQTAVNCLEDDDGNYVTCDERSSSDYDCVDTGVSIISDVIVTTRPSAQSNYVGRAYRPSLSNKSFSLDCDDVNDVTSVMHRSASCLSLSEIVDQPQHTATHRLKVSSLCACFD